MSHLPMFLHVIILAALWWFLFYLNKEKLKSLNPFRRDPAVAFLKRARGRR